MSLKTEALPSKTENVHTVKARDASCRYILQGNPPTCAQQLTWVDEMHMGPRGEISGTTQWRTQATKDTLQWCKFFNKTQNTQSRSMGRPQPQQLSLGRGLEGDQRLFNTLDNVVFPWKRKHLKHTWQKLNFEHPAVSPKPSGAGRLASGEPARVAGGLCSGQFGLPPPSSLLLRLHKCLLFHDLTSRSHATYPAQIFNPAW